MQRAGRGRRVFNSWRRCGLVTSGAKVTYFAAGAESGCSPTAGGQAECAAGEEAVVEQSERRRDRRKKSAPFLIGAH